MIYICAQPAVKYFGWQVDIFINSLVSNNIDQNCIHIICSDNSGVDPYFVKLKNKYPNVIFEYYNDTRDYTHYIPSIKQHLLYKHYKKHSYLENENIFLMDADAILIKPIDFNPLLKDNIWYFSDTNSYLNYDYIQSKGDDIVDTMCNIAGISKDILIANNRNSGGAQYLFKKVNTEYWNEVVRLSHSLYNKITKINELKVKENKEYHPLQIWTAEMWAILWVAWKNGQMTLVPKMLDFCWATDNISRWDKTSIFHNAGVIAPMKDLFYKGAYIDKFPDLNLNITNEKCSWHYYELLKKTLA